MEKLQRIIQHSDYITPDKSCEVEFIKNRTIEELLWMAKGSALLIIKHVDTEGQRAALTNKTKWNVYTEEPKTITEKHFYETLYKNGINHCFIPKINLNFFHDDTGLYIFSDKSGDSDIPDMIRMYPVKREEVLVLIKKLSGIDIHENINSDQVAEGICIVSQQDLIQDVESPDSANDDSRQRDQKSKTNEKNKELYINELTHIFNSKYGLTKMKCQGVSFEDITISLNDIYKKLGVEKGRLKGSWKLFDKNDIAEDLDIGVAKDAIKACKDKYSYKVEGYDYIIALEKRKAFSDAVNEIEAQYKRYISGEKIEIIGDIKILRQCRIKYKLEQVISELWLYLTKLCGKNEHNERIINKFLEKQLDKLDHFEDRIKIKQEWYNTMTYQWENIDFAKKILKVFTEKNIEKEFCDLLIEYISEFE